MNSCQDAALIQRAAFSGYLKANVGFNGCGNLLNVGPLGCARMRNVRL